MSPTIVRRTRVAIALMVTALVLTACLSPEQDEALRHLNGDRSAHGRAPVEAVDQLNAKAQSWAEHLARANGLSHSSLADGVSACWRGLGENVGYASSLPAVEEGFMASAGHRANILNPSFDRVGVGVARNGSRVFVVQVFMDAC